MYCVWRNDDDTWRKSLKKLTQSWPSKLTNVSQVLSLNIFLVLSSLPHLQSLKVMNRTQTCFCNLERQECLSVTSSCLDLINPVNVNRPFKNSVLIFMKRNEWARAVVVWKMLKSLEGFYAHTSYIHAVFFNYIRSAVIIIKV